MKFAPIVIAIVIATGCAILKPALRTVDDIAREACALYFAELQGISARDAARAYCATREALDPFIREILAAQRVAGAQSAGIQGVSLGGAPGE